MANKFIFEVNDMAEGVYMASGDAVVGNTCWRATIRLHQVPEVGRENWVFQIDAEHGQGGGEGHSCEQQQIRIVFNTTIKNAWGNWGGDVQGIGSNTLVLRRWNHANWTESVGFGDLYVVADSEPGILSIEMTDEVNGLYIS